MLLGGTKAGNSGHSLMRLNMVLAPARVHSTIMENLNCCLAMLNSVARNLGCGQEHTSVDLLRRCDNG